MVELEPIMRMSRDLRRAASTLSDRQARYLVDVYYVMQANRIRADAQTREAESASEPTDTVRWFAAQSDLLERQIRSALGEYVKHHPVGSWMIGICGIGPVLSAGLLANIDIRKAETVGDIWAFAGLAPGVAWSKGQRRPWNAQLKTLCWKAGESFVKVQRLPQDVYGKIYALRKALEIARNETGHYAEMAAKILASKKWREGTEARRAYESGRLPKAHIYARAKRYAVKHFLADLHAVWYFREFGTLPPKPYPLLVIGEHRHWRLPGTLEVVDLTDLAAVAAAHRRIIEEITGRPATAEQLGEDDIGEGGGDELDRW